MNSAYTNDIKVGSVPWIWGSLYSWNLLSPCRLFTTDYSLSSEVLDLAEQAAQDVVDEAADNHFPRNPGMSAQLLQLVAYVFVDVLEGVEKCRCNGSCAGAILDARAQFLLGGVH